MRSSAPVPGNPWPHDMSITVEDRPNTLLELLWIREAYELQPYGEDLPPRLLDVPAAVQHPAVTAKTRDEWAIAWPGIWHSAVMHAGQDSDPQLFDELHNTANGSTERADLLHRITGPDWRAHFGDNAFDDESSSTWFQRGMDAHLAGMPTQLQAQPERRDLPALIPAWRAGLTKIVTIPCAGEFTRRINDNALLMTAATRENSDSYRHALGTFI
ncbi:hypothetical protein ABTZ44_16850 [Microbacterium oxydans]|uniref:hypothetical protein n=1 Tax=Microbacterium TaxID=33882 RepID=UPI00187D2CF9|nr:hypothetical protein [Microbacterium sp. R1]MBE7956321.1 hypothetical protein [Microbacterium sp. R1]